VTTLQALRIYGPLDAFDVQSKTGGKLDDIADSIWKLHRKGFACNPTDYLWDITPAGRLLFDAQCAVRRDEARECVGVAE
jgi:hypothetical protein